MFLAVASLGGGVGWLVSDATSVMFNLIRRPGRPLFLLISIYIALNISAGATARAPSGASRQEVDSREGSVTHGRVGGDPQDERFRPAAVPLGEADVPGKERLPSADRAVDADVFA